MLKPFQPIAITVTTGVIPVPVVNKDVSGAPLNNDEPMRVEVYDVTGTQTLSGALSLSPTTTVKYGMQMNFKYRARLTLNGNTFSIFGRNFTAAEALVDANVNCWYNGSSWDVTYIPDEPSGLADGSVTEPKLADNALSPRTFQNNSVPERAFQNTSLPTSAFKQQSIHPTFIQDKSLGAQQIGDHQVVNDLQGLMKPGSVKGGDDSWLPVDIDMNEPGSGAILIAQGYGRRAQSKLMQGHMTLDKDGFAQLVPGSVQTIYLGTYAVTPDKADITMVSDPLYFNLDFSLASRNRKRMFYKGYVWGVYASVEKAIVGNGTITIKNNADVVMGVINVVSGEPKDTTAYFVAFDLGLSQFDAYDTLKFECAGSSEGIVGLSVICIKRS